MDCHARTLLVRSTLTPLKRCKVNLRTPCEAATASATTRLCSWRRGRPHPKGRPSWSRSCAAPECTSRTCRWHCGPYGRTRPGKQRGYCWDLSTSPMLHLQPACTRCMRRTCPWRCCPFYSIRGCTRPCCSLRLSSSQMPRAALACTKPRSTPMRHTSRRSTASREAAGRGSCRRQCTVRRENRQTHRR